MIANLWPATRGGSRGAAPPAARHILPEHPAPASIAFPLNPCRERHFRERKMIFRKSPGWSGTSDGVSRSASALALLRASSGNADACPPLGGASLGWGRARPSLTRARPSLRRASLARGRSCPPLTDARPQFRGACLGRGRSRPSLTRARPSLRGASLGWGRSRPWLTRAGPPLTDMRPPLRGASLGRGRARPFRSQTRAQLRSACLRWGLARPRLTHARPHSGGHFSDWGGRAPRSRRRAPAQTCISLT
jgi:hypothetical protein